MSATRSFSPQSVEVELIRASSTSVELEVEHHLSERVEAEFAWMSRVPGLSPATARLLSARAGAVRARLQGESRQASGLQALLADQLCGKALETFELTQPEAVSARDLWTLALPLEALLASGGDERLTLGPDGLNKYGCSPWPRPQVVAFGSCTASSLTEGAFDTAGSARRQLFSSASKHGKAHAIAQLTGDMEANVLEYFGAADLATAILTASGTDAALTITGLLAAESKTPLTSILVSPAETGSGVPLAVQGRHFASSGPDGQAVPKAEALAGFGATPHLVTVDLRASSGFPRSHAEIAQDCEDAIVVAARHGRVVLHAIDGSKTGLTAPDRPSLLRLAKRFGATLDIVIDACQARIEPALVRWYLSHGFPVLVTGSKFFGAPGFCGAILFPRLRLSRIRRHVEVPNGMDVYAHLDDGIGSRRCAGLLLRWSAAIHEMTRFGALLPEQAGHQLDRLGCAVAEALKVDERLCLFDAPRPAGMGWSDRRSVFTFAVRSGEGWLRAADLRTLYLSIQEDGRHSSLPTTDGAGVASPCQIGQPVELGTAGIGGLRIAFSSDQICSGRTFKPELALVVEKLRRVLDERENISAGEFTLLA